VRRPGRVVSRRCPIIGRVICPGFVDTDMGYVVPGANPANFLTVEDVVDVARYLLHTGDNVKLGPQILLRTMRNPMGG